VRFFIDAGVGTMIGILVAWLIIRAARRTKDWLAESLLTLAAPYVAWIVAESLHVSAVLACVAGGLYLRQHWSTAVGASSRLQNRAVWDLLVFLLNAMIFLLLGVEFGGLIQSVPTTEIGAILRIGAIISGVAIVARMIWVPLAAWIPRAMYAEIRRREPEPSPKALFLIGWTSMRGIVSLATALALPLVLADGRPFPFRTELILITMTVIVITLLVQGFSLGPIIRRFNFAPEQAHHDEERLARREALRRGAEALDDLSRESWADPRDVEWLRAEVRDRMRMHEHHGGGTSVRRRLRAGMIHAERRILVRLRNEGAISDEVLRELEQELDLESIRVGAGDAR
jgi:CPA1 family monovalent cation:H+ antiporter